MGHVEIREEVSLERPTLIEGLLGVGLVGKIATDHVIAELDMTYFGFVRCPGLPRVAVYEAGDRETYPAVRLYASEAHDLVVLRSDVPVSPSQVDDFATCVTRWIAERDGMPVYVSGFPAEVEAEGSRELYGVATGNAETLLEDLDVQPPETDGVWSGPTGALLARADEVGMDAVGLIVESDPQFPDPEAACAYINQGVNPIAGVNVDDAGIRDHAEDIRSEKEQLAQQMGQTGDESSKAGPVGMYQ